MNLGLIDGLEPCRKPEQASYEETNILRKLEQRKLGLEAQVAEVDKAITALKAHPEVEEILSLLRRI